MAKETEPIQDMSSAQKDRVQIIAERMTKCMTTAMSNDAATSYPSQAGGQ